MPLGRTRKDLQQHTQQVPDIPFPIPRNTIASLTAKIIKNFNAQYVFKFEIANANQPISKTRCTQTDSDLKLWEYPKHITND